MPFSIVDFNFTDLTNLINNTPEASAIVSRLMTFSNPTEDTWKSHLVDILEAQFLSATGEEYSITVNSTGETEGFIIVTPPSASAYELPYGITKGVSEKDNTEEDAAANNEADALRSLANDNSKC